MTTTTDIVSTPRTLNCSWVYVWDMGYMQVKYFDLTNQTIAAHISVCQDLYCINLVPKKDKTCEFILERPSLDLLSPLVPVFVQDNF